MAGKIKVELRTDQLDDIVDALQAFADDCDNDAELLNRMARVDTETVADLVKRQGPLLKLASWLQHVKEEAE